MKPRNNSEVRKAYLKFAAYLMAFVLFFVFFFFLQIDICRFNFCLFLKDIRR